MASPIRPRYGAAPWGGTRGRQARGSWRSYSRMPPVTEPRRHLGVGAALSVLVQGGPLLAGATLSIVLARTIGPSANGRFTLLGTLAGLLELVFSLSLSAGIVYEVSRRRWTVRQAFHTCYVAGFALRLIALGV